MASFELKLDTSKWNEVMARLGDKSNWRSILRRVASVVAFKDVIAHFKDEKGPDGAWAEWSPSYKRQRERIADRLATPSARRRASRAGVKPVAFSKKLVLTGTLRQSFMTPFDRPSGNEVSVLVNHTPYARRHDLGGGNVPQRQFMWLSNNALDLIASNFLFSLKRSADAV
jgi:phage gpG-like protein